MRSLWLRRSKAATKAHATHTASGTNAARATIAGALSVEDTSASTFALPVPGDVELDGKDGGGALDDFVGGGGVRIRGNGEGSRGGQSPPSSRQADTLHGCWQTPSATMSCLQPFAHEASMMPVTSDASYTPIMYSD
eukprot:CAMPEP_0206036538 /NCGR_PEP_ID=MMETSP1466-20131121/2838_1 /ASSEMBLY_ACC=CAM_ASM_001126 /TAXON_ID=44452 /ORGANISM="Pavlova gyrans, Strain CCMP608" /LENGTH=136 /DNA_ID=CAMNT_0053411019 /DNA_START=483 /DNA_END=890 /DNA_ORIENTATION=-